MRSSRSQAAVLVANFDCGWMLAMPLEVGGFSRVEKVDPDAMMIRPEVNQLPRKFGEYLCPLGIGLRGLLIAVRNIIGTGRL